MTSKTEIVTALIAAQISRDYTGTRMSEITVHVIEQALRVANTILAANEEK